MGEEIERKWLVNEIPFDLTGFPSNEINQGYMEVSDSKNDEVRVRRKGNKYFLTIKRGEGVKREETEVEISAETYYNIWSLPTLSKVEKIRYDILNNEHLIELDIYKGKLEGLVTAEVEFENIEASQSYNFPEWFGKEVTDDKRYKNKNLAMNGLASLRSRSAID
jgi:adenylate cyclase